MTVPEKFVLRWARLKREVALTRETEPAVEFPQQSATAVVPDPGAVSLRDENEAAAYEPFDPASLPSIEAITVDTDIRAFLQSKVPAELTRAALRQAWASDPAIRDFIGIAENQWDFNDPTAMPGFGPLRENDSVPAPLEQALGRFDKLANTFSEIQEQPIEQVPAAVTDLELDDCGQSVRQAANMLPAVAGDIGRSPDNGDGESSAIKSDRAAERNESTRIRRWHGGALPR